MPVRKLKEFLDQNGVRWVSIVHSPAYTAQEIAASAHVKGKELAKTVMVKVDGKPVMVVLPASQRVDFQVLRDVTGGTVVVLLRRQAGKTDVVLHESRVVRIAGRLEREALTEEEIAVVEGR